MTTNEGTRSSISERYKGVSDEELVGRVVEGDEQSFAELVGRYNGRLTHFLNRSYTSGVDTEDLLQETWVRVFRHAGRFDPTKKFSTWVYTIAGNLGKNSLRNRSRRGRQIPLDNPTPDNRALSTTLPAEDVNPQDILVEEEEVFSYVDGGGRTRIWFNEERLNAIREVFAERFDKSQGSSRMSSPSTTRSRRAPSSRAREAGQDSPQHSARDPPGYINARSLIGHSPNRREAIEIIAKSGLFGELFTYKPGGKGTSYFVRKDVEPTHLLGMVKGFMDVLKYGRMYTEPDTEGASSLGQESLEARALEGAQTRGAPLETSLDMHEAVEALSYRVKQLESAQENSKGTLDDYLAKTDAIAATVGEIGSRVNYLIEELGVDVGDIDAKDTSRTE